MAQASLALQQAGVDRQTRIQILTNAGLIKTQAGATASTTMLGAAFKGLWITIVETTKAMATWLVTNPVGWAVMAVAALGAVNGILEKVRDNYIKTREEIVETANETISKNNDEKRSLESLQSSLIEAKGNKEKLWAISSDLNTLIGKTPGLLEGETKAWEIANQKIRDRIKLLDAQIERETTAKVQAQKEIFDKKVQKNSLLGIDWLASDDSATYMRSIARMVSGGGEGTAEQAIGNVVKELLDRGGTLEEAYKTVATMISSMGSSFNLSLDDFRKYFRENTLLAQELLSEMVAHADTGFFGDGFLNLFIEKSVYSGKTIEEVQGELKNFISDIALVNEQVDAYYTAINEGKESDGILQSIQQSFVDLADKYVYAKDLIASNANDLSQLFAKNLEGVDFTLQGTLSADKFSEAVQQAEKFRTTLENVKKEMSEGGLKTSTITSIIDDLTKAGEDYLNYFSVVNGELVLNSQKYEDWAYSVVKNNLDVLESNKETLEEQKVIKEAERQQLLDSIQAQKDFITQYEKLQEDAHKGIAPAIHYVSDHADEYNEAKLKVGEYESSLSNLDAQLESTKSQLNETNNSLEVQNSIIDTILTSNADFIQMFDCCSSQHFDIL